MARANSPTVLHHFLVNKPYGMLSQFTPEAGRPTLRSLAAFPRDVYPVGRLDAESEGLLLLTNDNALKAQLTHPKYGHPRTYLVQVEHIPPPEALQRLRHGILLDGRITRSATVRFLDTEPALPPRPVPIRHRKAIATAWLEVTLREGRNRQVRRMTAAVGHPTLRLIRTHIGVLSIDGLAPGEWRRLTNTEVRALTRQVSGRSARP